MKQLFFSFEGRIGRKTWWLATLGLIGVLIAAQVIMVALAAMSETAGLIGAIFTLIVALACLIPAIALPVKRWHDLDKSGWFTVLGFIPVANLYALVMCGFIRGTDGQNQYGPDPVVEGAMGHPRTA